MTAVTKKNKKAEASSSNNIVDDNSATATAKRIKALLRVQPQDESIDAARLDELRKIFARLIASKELIVQSETSSTQLQQEKLSEVKAKWNEWLRKQHDLFLEQLQDRIRHNQRKSALRTFFGVIASSPVTITTNDGTSSWTRINGRLVQKLLVALVQPDDGGFDLEEDDDDNHGLLPEDLLQMLDMEFMNPYQDVKYYILFAIHAFAKTTNHSQKTKKHNDVTKQVSIIGENLVRILIKMNVATTKEDLVVQEVKHGSNGNYLITPPKGLFPVQKEGDEEDEEEQDDDDDDESDDGNEDEEEESSSDEEEEEASRKKRKLDEKDKKGFVMKKRKKDPKTTKELTVPSFMKLSSHLRSLQESWLEVLRLPHLPIRSLKLALQHLPVNVLPIVPSPLRYADFCIRAYDNDESVVTSILALHSLYYLMLEEGLEYPKFYASLYKLVTPNVFFTKHRTRFFKLLSNCLLKSQMLPGYIVAAFCKRLCRCALSSPPSGSLFVMALVSNLIRKHGECGCLVHRGNGIPIEDVFDSETNDPASCRALESSLWELNALERHYHPAVSTLAKACGMEDEKTTPYYNMDEFMIHTYKSLFEQERKKGDVEKKKKKSVPLTFKEPKSLFVKPDGEYDLFGSILMLPSNDK